MEPRLVCALENRRQTTKRGKTSKLISNINGDSLKSTGKAGKAQKSRFCF